MIRRSLTILSVVTLSSVVLAQGTPPPQDPKQQTPTFRTRVDSVSVDVSVTDRNGRPVTDLRQEDFEIKEAGKVQAIETFRLIRRDEDADIRPTYTRNILSFNDMARETADPRNSLYIVMLDDYHTTLANSMNVRQYLGKWARELSPLDLVAVLYPMSPIGATTFSRDHEGTATAMMAFEGRKYNYLKVKYFEEQQLFNLPPEVQEQFRNDVTIRTMRSACSLLSSLREGRKTILYVSEGMSANLPAGVGIGNATMFPPRQPLTPQQALTQTNQQASRQFFNSADLLGRMRDIFTTCSRGNVSIFSVDPRGLAPSEFGVAERVDANTDRAVLNESLDVLRTLADQTDGRAIIGKNDPIPDLRKMVEELGSYYLLSYTSTIAPRDGKFHEIDVNVKRRDVNVKARKGYWAYTDEEIKRASAPPKPGPPEEVSQALGELAAVAEPASRRNVAFWVGATRTEAEHAQVTLVWEARPGVPDTPADRVEQVSATVTSLNGDSIFKGVIPKDPAAFRPSGRVTFPAPAGPLRMRLILENGRGQRVDAEDLNEMIPDFTATFGTITNPQVFRARTAIEVAQIKKTPAALPVAGRVFSRTERLLLRFDAYGPAGTTPQVTMRLLNRMGEPMADLPAPALSTGRTFEADVPLAQLSPGDYLIEIAAVNGTDRTVRLLGVRITG